MSGNKLSGAKRRKGKLKLEKKACTSNKVLQRFLKKQTLKVGMKAMINWLHTKVM